MAKIAAFDSLPLHVGCIDEVRMRTPQIGIIENWKAPESNRALSHTVCAVDRKYAPRYTSRIREDEYGVRMPSRRTLAFI